MKNLIALAWGLLCLQAYAHDRFGVNLVIPESPLSAGLRFGTGCGFHNEAQGYKTVYPSSGFGAPVSEKPIYGSLGKGILGSAFVDYRFSDHWGAGISVNNLFGTPFDYHTSTNNSDYHDEEVRSGFYTNFMLEFMFETCCDGPLNAHTRFGPAFMLRSGFTSEYTETQNGTVQQHTMEKYMNSFGLGFSGSVGADYKINDHFSLSLDLGSLMFSGKQKSSELTQYEINGADKLSDLKTAERKVNYVDEWTQSSNTPGNGGFNADKPSEYLTTRNSYSSLFWTIGFDFRF